VELEALEALEAHREAEDLGGTEGQETEEEYWAFGYTTWAENNRI